MAGRKVLIGDPFDPDFKWRGPPPPDLTPAPALLRALAHVGEVDLAKGLGRERLAQLIHADLPGASRWSWTWGLTSGALLLIAAIAALFVALR